MIPPSGQCANLMFQPLSSVLRFDLPKRSQVRGQVVHCDTNAARVLLFIDLLTLLAPNKANYHIPGQYSKHLYCVYKSSHVCW
jgi:hypothetical protein